MAFLRKCKHEELKCVHGDMINYLGTRAVCKDCGRRMKGEPLPYLCEDGRPHYSYQVLLDYELPWLAQSNLATII